MPFRANNSVICIKVYFIEVKFLCFSFKNNFIFVVSFEPTIGPPKTLKTPKLENEDFFLYTCTLLLFHVT